MDRMASIERGATREDGSQEYLIVTGQKRRSVAASAESMRCIRQIMVENADLMRRLADR